MQTDTPSPQSQDAGAVLLVNPLMCRPGSTRLPLSVLNLAAVLEGRRPWQILDGNRGPITAAALAALGARPHAMVGVTVMPGPQVAPAIEISAAIRAACPSVPIVWGGYFPTLYPDSAINAPYVDYLVRGQGEATMLDLLARLPDAGSPSATDSARDAGAIKGVAGLTWKRDGRPVHNPERALVNPDTLPPCPTSTSATCTATCVPASWASARLCTRPPSAAGSSASSAASPRCGTAARCSMHPRGWRLPCRTCATAGARTGVQFYDHNFFYREENSIPVLEVLARLQMPWWCYARSDALARFQPRTLELLRKSRLRMTYIGAEAASDEVLNSMRKGSKVDHTLEVAARCREYGVIPEFSFVLGGPEDAEGEIEKTLSFIRASSSFTPTCEIILYFYSPTPQIDSGAAAQSSRRGAPSRPEHVWSVRTGAARHARGMDRTALDQLGVSSGRALADAAHSPARDGLRPRARVPLSDRAGPPHARWGKTLLQNLARWRYATGNYAKPIELAIGQRLLGLRDPRSESI